jgi:D-alanyl-D-alanine carboxypeptidase
MVRKEGLAAALVLGPAGVMWRAFLSTVAAILALWAGRAAQAEANDAPVPAAQVCDRTPGVWDEAAEANTISL